MTTPDLSPQEQAHVINALHFLHAKFEGWLPVAKLLQTKEHSLIEVRARKRDVSVLLAFRVAKVLGVGFDALVAETWHEPGVCPRCGYEKARGARE